MSKEHKPKRESKGPVRCRDLTELITLPLTAQIDQIGLQVIQKIQEVADSVEIIGRQIAREIEEKK